MFIEVGDAEFKGVLGCDCFSAYRRSRRESGVLLPFCVADLIRAVKFLTTLPDARDRAHGGRWREALRQWFAVIHRREELSAVTFRNRGEAARSEVLCCGTPDVPGTNHRRTLAKRWEAEGASYFRSLTTPGVEPTNKLAEPAVRFVVRSWCGTGW